MRVPSDSADLDAAIWAEIARHFGPRLRPAATTDAIAAASRELGFRVPPTVAQAYLRHDGDAGAPSRIFGELDPEARWLPLEAAVTARLFEQQGYEAQHYTDWFLLGASDTSCIWVYPGDEKLFRSKRASICSLGVTAEGWLRGAAEGGYRSPLRPSPAAPALTPDHAGRVLLAVLSERRFIAVDEGADRDRLAWALAKALRARRVNRVAAVLQALDDDRSVEVFAGDEAIALLVEDLAG